MSDNKKEENMSNPARLAVQLMGQLAVGIDHDHVPLAPKDRRHRGGSGCNAGSSDSNILKDLFLSLTKVLLGLSAYATSKGAGQIRKIDRFGNIQNRSFKSEVGWL